MYGILQHIIFQLKRYKPFFVAGDVVQPEIFINCILLYGKLFNTSASALFCFINVIFSICFDFFLEIKEAKN